MIGVFDSGVGGFNSLSVLRKYLPKINIVYLADRKNAPYGTKTEEEIINLANRNISRLADMGAKRVLIACCTASSLWHKLSDEQRMISLPIIAPTVAALSGKEKRIMVIATERTVKNGCFGKEIKLKNPNATVIEVAMQSLVSAVEHGVKNNSLVSSTEENMRELILLVGKHEPDTIILGCTHFSSVEFIIRSILPEIKVVSPAYLGAKEMVQSLSRLGINAIEEGKITYT